jgi:hypothetical protein
LSAIGIMGEDETDVLTLRTILRRMIPREVGIERRNPPRGRAGCAALRKAAKTYMKELHAAGCHAVILLHALDLSGATNELNDEGRLRARLAAIPVPEGLARLICIPVEELEAWFWSDQNVLDKIGPGGKASASPHTIKRPKEQLRDLSWRAHRKYNYATTQNPGLAEILDLELCARRCPSFAALREFVAAQL